MSAIKRIVVINIFKSSLTLIYYIFSHTEYINSISQLNRIPTATSNYTKSALLLETVFEKKSYVKVVIEINFPMSKENV